MSAFRLISPGFMVLGSVMALAGLATAQTEKPAKRKPSIVVLGLSVAEEASAIDADTVGVVQDMTRALRHEVRKSAGPYRLAPNSNKTLGEMAVFAGCSEESLDCMARIGKEMGGDLVLYGGLRRVRGEYRVTVTLLDVRSRSWQPAVGRLSIARAKSSKSLSAWSRDLYARVTTMSNRGDGEVVITCNASAGVVLVDGARRGSLVRGTARITGLDKGPRAIVIDAPGFRRHTGAVTIASGAAARLYVTLKSNPSDPGARLAIQTIPANAAITIDGEAVDRRREVYPVTSGEHTIEVTSSGHTPQRLTIQVERGKVESLRITLQPGAVGALPALTDAGQDGSSSRFGAWKWASLGSGVALIAAGGVLISIDGTHSENGMRLAEQNDTLPGGIGTVAVGTALIGAAVYMLVKDRAETDERSLAFQLWRGSAGIGVTGRF